MTRPLLVFISGTGDLADFRKAAEAGLEGLHMEGSLFESWPSTPNHPVNECLKKVEEADAMVLILGSRYGSIADTGCSVTHLEYRRAIGRLPMPLPVFLYPLRCDQREPLQEAFLQEARKLHLHCGAEITTPADLQSQVQASFVQELARCFRERAVKPATALRVEVANLYQGRPVKCCFFRQVSHSYDSQCGEPRPKGTAFQFYLKVTNVGQANTSIRDFALKVTVGNEEWAVRQRLGDPHTYVTCRDAGTPLWSSLRRGQDLPVGPGASEEVALAMTTDQNVPDGITRIRGTVTCTDIREESVTAQLRFDRFDERPRTQAVSDSPPRPATVVQFRRYGTSLSGRKSPLPLGVPPSPYPLPARERGS